MDVKKTVSFSNNQKTAIKRKQDIMTFQSDIEMTEPTITEELTPYDSENFLQQPKIWLSPGNQVNQNECRHFECIKEKLNFQVHSVELELWRDAKKFSYQHQLQHIKYSKLSTKDQFTFKLCFVL